MKPERREDMEPRQRRFRNSEFGFSIIEIVFVVAMIGILGSMAVIQLQPSIDRYRLVSSANMVGDRLKSECLFPKHHHG